METLELKAFGGIFRDKRVLVTGHTGFKGSWLCAWLQLLGARVFGYALPPEGQPNHHQLLDPGFVDELADIRDGQRLEAFIQKARPQLVFHMAAQSLVRRSYKEPLHTLDVNVMGTARLLEICRLSPGLQAVVVVTSDKCYAPSDQNHEEGDPLGGCDPYSVSKACAELVTASWRDSFFGEQPPLLATVRAGNVVGGGDYSTDRLVPDLVQAALSGKPAAIRYPDATRPWQHVLDCLSGYLQLAEGLLQGKHDLAGVWNFGPDDEVCSVRRLVEIMAEIWPAVSWQIQEGDFPKESATLSLNSHKARVGLNWRILLDMHQTLAWTARWYHQYHLLNKVSTREQIQAYMKQAQAAEMSWM